MLGDGLIAFVAGGDEGGWVIVSVRLEGKSVWVGGLVGMVSFFTDRVGSWLGFARLELSQASIA